MNDQAEPVASPWRGVLSLACGLIALFVFFVVRDWSAASFGETADAVFSRAVTWLPVLLPPCGLVLGVLGTAQDRQKGLAILGILVNGVGLLVAAFILYILAG